MLLAQKFAESLLDVADNLESAARAVPQNVLQEGADVPADTALKYLRSLLEGVQATERTLLKVNGALSMTVGCAGLGACRSLCWENWHSLAFPGILWHSLTAVLTLACTDNDAMHAPLGLLCTKVHDVPCVV